MREQKKEAIDNKKNYPLAIVGAFIFNDKDELLLVKQPKWHNKYANIGGKVELGETIEEAVQREVKEEVNLDIFDLEFINIIDGLGLEKSYKLNNNHFIFIDYKVKTKDDKKIKLNEEIKEYKWMKLDEWLKLKESKFAPYVFEVLQKIKDKSRGDFADLYKRALADYQNLLKQTAKEKQEFIKYAHEQLLLEILPVYDNLKISFAHADESADQNGWLTGVKYIIKQFQDILHNLGVEEIKTIGRKFDPHTMEAIDGKGEKVKKEVKAGYKLKGKVITPARVIVK